MRASAILVQSMVLSLWMSSGRTMPATTSSRISKLTRTSCLPSMTRLPFGKTCVTTAATLVKSDSVRVTEPLPSLDAVGHPGVFLVGAAALGVVGDRGIVGNLDNDGQDVADLMRALVFEEGAR